MIKYLSIAILITGFLVGNAYGEDRIVDIHFDDGSVLHNARSIYSGGIEVKYENEFFTLNFEDLKTLEFKVELGNRWVSGKGDYGVGSKIIGTEAIVTLKIKTKTGIVINDRFSTADRTFYHTLGKRDGAPCTVRSYSFTNKLTGREVTKYYSITNLGHEGDRCFFKQHETKAIKSIVFKDGNKKIEEVEK